MKEETFEQAKKVRGEIEILRVLMDDLKPIPLRSYATFDIKINDVVIPRKFSVSLMHEIYGELGRQFEQKTKEFEAL